MSPELHSVTGDKNTDSKSSQSLASSVIGNPLVDDTFDPQRSDSYHLSIEISKWIVSLCVLDTLNNKYIALHTEEVAGAGDSGGVEHLLRMIQTQDLFRPKYKSVSLVLVDDKFTTIPTPLYNRSENRSFLNFNIEGLQDENHAIEVHSNKLNGTEAYNLYPINITQIAELRSALGAITIMHHTTSLIDTLVSLVKNKNEKTCFLHFQKGIFSLIVIEGNSLRYCNNFLYSSKEDLAYYTLFVCEQLQLNPESLKMVLLGEIGKESAEYEILFTYIRDLSFIDRHSGFSYSYKLDALPAHYHFNLFSQYHCVS